MVHRSESGEVFGAEGSCHTPVQQCLNHLDFRMRTFRLSGAVATLYHPRINH